MPVIPLGDTEDRRAELLPENLLPLFNDDFVLSWDHYGVFVSSLVSACSQTLGFNQAAGDRAVSALELVGKCNLAADRTSIVEWLLRALVAAGTASILDIDGTAKFRFDGCEPATDHNALREQALRHTQGAEPAYELAETAADALPAFLRGETSGEQVLLAADKLALWGRYFSNANPLYAINNLVGAEACITWAPKGKLRILELGGGMGSAADAFLQSLERANRIADITSYRFSELVLPFLRRGQRLLQARWADQVPLTFARLDMNENLENQGIESGSVDLVWAVNTLHVADNLGATLEAIHGALAPGGVLVAGECIRPFERQPLPPELIFNLLETFREPTLDARWRPRGGFLTPEQWCAACTDSGFDTVTLFPDISKIRHVYPDFVVAAVVARKAP